MFDVTCLGILCADAIAKPINTLPEEGKLTLIDQLELHTGGCATNTGIDLARIGINTAIIGKVGKDGFGNFLVSELEKYNVNTSGLKQQEGLNTSASVVVVNGKGERSFLHCLGSNAEFVEEDIDYSIIEKSKILFVAGSLLMPKFDGEPTARVLKKVKELGVYTVLDTAWDSTGRWMKAIEPCLPYLDLFIPSVEEAEMISGKSDVEEMSQVFLSKGVKLVVIKLGKKGCYIESAEGDKYFIPAYEVEEPADTTGAGDSFVAGFITGIVKEWDLYTCGKFANAVGAHCVMSMGASGGIKPLNEILKFMNEYKWEV